MLFNSIEFALFFPTVFLLYWLVFPRNLRAQNGFLLAASYFFYACWDWRFLFLMLFSSLVDFWVGRQLESTKREKHRKVFLGLSIGVNLGILFFFKYFDFFIDTFAATFTLLGYPLAPDRLNLILPVGLSFYTFQSMSYSIDVYRGKLEPTRDLLSFLTFVSFFPQLVAGPIERAGELLPQVRQKRQFKYEEGVDGLRQILWGLFKKIVIADGCAVYVEQVFSDPGGHSGLTLVLVACLFLVQVYGDFSGYSDIAIGSARLLGFRLSQNFAFPLFARNVAEFWRRWNITLMTWFRDYLYFPLGGSRKGPKRQFLHIMIVFLLCGLWHGAAPKFVIWGGLHGLLFLPLIVLGRNRSYLGPIAPGRKIPSAREMLAMSGTFLLVSLVTIVFRASSLGAAWFYLKKMVSNDQLLGLTINPTGLFYLALLVGLIVEWWNRDRQHGLAELERFFPRWSRYLLYYGLLIFIALFAGRGQSFIYFQF